MPSLLEVRSLNKAFAAPVLRDFDFGLAAGEVHALIGSNGAGKSTFARILAGLLRADRGEVLLAGEPHAPATRREAQQRGVTLMLQELNVLPTLTVAENVFLPRLPRRFGFVDRRRLAEDARGALARVGLERLDPLTPASTLGVGQQQLVELAAALAEECRLLILDEPTAALTGAETARLFENLRRLRRGGVGVLYISHRIEELREIADRVTVLRDGQRVITAPLSEVSTDELVRQMAGHEVPLTPPLRARQPGEVALRVQGLRAGDAVRGVSFAVRRGEILGLSGLVGSGRTETLRVIFGADAKDSGEIELGEPLRAVEFRQPSEAARAGLGLVPEDRKLHGLLLPQSVRTNATLSTLGRHSRGGFVNAGAERDAAAGISARLDVRCQSIEQPVAELSGGNQQKAVMSRWLLRDCEVLLLDEPTRGVDVATKEAIHALLRDLAEAGKALVVVSSELVELM